MTRASRYLLSFLTALLVSLQALAPAAGWAEVQMRCAGMPVAGAPCVQSVVAAESAAVDRTAARMRCCCCAPQQCALSTALASVASPRACVLTVRTIAAGTSTTATRASRVSSPTTCALPPGVDLVASDATRSDARRIADRSTVPSAGPPRPTHGLRAPPSI